MLSRRWKAPMGIGEGETRAAVAWSRVLAAAPESARHEILDVSDNFSAVAILTRGRAHVKPLNDQCRVQAACEGAGQFRTRVSWSDTTRMPPDQGTRESETGRLNVGRLLRPARSLFIEVFAGS